MTASKVDEIEAMKATARQQDTATLCEALTILDRPGLFEAERLARAVLMDVLCERYPAADAAADAWASDESAYQASTLAGAITTAALAAASDG